MDQRQENGGRRLTLRQWGRIALAALFFTPLASTLRAETGPEKVDFYCNSLAAARASVDPDTLEALRELRYCLSFEKDHGFTAYGELTYVETIEGTDRTIWWVDFGNGTWVYTVR